MNVVEANGIGKSFRNTNALHNVNLKLNQGETLVLLGPNGAGKSTLLKILAGLYKPTNGFVKVFGYELPIHAQKIRKEVSFLGENYALYDDLTVRKNLEFFAHLYDIDQKEIQSKIKSLLSSFDAIQYIDRKVGELSRGTKQKVAICRALINNPKLLLLDEPSAFLDPVASRILHMRLNALSSNNVSIVYATQRLDELYKIGNKTLLLRKGKVIAYGDVNSIINKLKDVDVEILMMQALPTSVFSKLNRKWKLRYGDSERAIVFSLKKISEIPKAVKEVVNNGGQIVSVLYLKESIDKILSGRE